MECRSAAAAPDRELPVRPAALVIVPGVASSPVRVLALSKLAAVAHRHPNTTSASVNS